MNAANARNPDGWYAGYVTKSRWGGDRLSVNARHSQAFVAHSNGVVFFPTPPEDINPAAYELAFSIESSLDGASIQWSKIGEADDGRQHPYLVVAGQALRAALDAGARDLIDATMDWRMVSGKSPKHEVHSPALVRVAGFETSSKIAQPGYED
jgi:hypothetical protein